MWNNNFYGSNFGQMPSPLSGLYCVVVNSESEVHNYLVAANSTVLLICFNLKRFWLKSTDQNGIQTLREFDFNEKEVPTLTSANQQNSAEIDALKKEIAEIKALLEANKGGNPA